MSKPDEFKRFSQTRFHKKNPRIRIWIQGSGIVFVILNSGFQNSRWNKKKIKKSYAQTAIV